jgi:GNAT superfamily N-acetyltransferase
VVVALTGFLRADGAVDLPLLVLAGLAEHCQQDDPPIRSTPVRYPGRDIPKPDPQLPGIAVQHVDEGNSEAAVRFFSGWVCDGEAGARRYLAGHVEPDGISLIATSGAEAVGYVAILWESNYAGFRSRGIPLVHQISVSEPWRRRGVATMLMDAAEQRAADRGTVTLGINVGLFDRYGPTRLCPRRQGRMPGPAPAQRRHAGTPGPRRDHLAHQGADQLTSRCRPASRHERAAPATSIRRREHHRQARHASDA